MAMKEYLTDDGKELMAQMIAGKKTITFTKIEMGDGTLTNGRSRTTMTALISLKVTLDIYSVDVSDDNLVTISGMFTNEELTEGFYFREKGLYATDGRTEILFAYANAGDSAEYIDPPSVELIEKQIISIYTEYQGTEATINITTKSGIYITRTDMEDYVEDNALSQINPSGSGSVSINRDSDSKIGENSVVIGGSGGTATKSNSATIGGKGLVASMYDQTVVGRYNEESGSMFVVGVGRNSTGRKNGFEVDKNGATVNGILKAGDYIEDGDGIRLNSIAVSTIKGSGAGSNITLKNTIDAAMILSKWEIPYGKTEMVVTSCGKNIYGGITFANRLKEMNNSGVTIDTDAKTVSFSHNLNFQTNSEVFGNFKANTQYTFILKGKSNNIKTANITILYTDGTNEILKFDEVDVEQTKKWVSDSNKTVSAFRYTWSAVINMTLYYDECGIFEGNVDIRQFKAYQHETVTVTNESVSPLKLKSYDVVTNVFSEGYIEIGYAVNTTGGDILKNITNITYNAEEDATFSGDITTKNGNSLDNIAGKFTAAIESAPTIIAKWIDTLDVYKKSGIAFVTIKAGDWTYPKNITINGTKAYTIASGLPKPFGNGYYEYLNIETNYHSMVPVFITPDGELQIYHATTIGNFTGRLQQTLIYPIANEIEGGESSNNNSYSPVETFQSSYLQLATEIETNCEKVK